MESVHQEWLKTNGYRLFTWYIQPSSPTAAVLLVHGLGEHSMRYQTWAKQFADAGFAFYCWDHVGHGQSSGQRGCVPNYEHLLQEVDFIINKFNRQIGSIPLVLYGHSMGGNIALNYAIRRPSKINLLVVTSPWLKLVSPLNPALKSLVKLLDLCLPFLPMNSGIRPEQVSHEMKVVQEYATDPLIHRRITPRLYLAMERAAEYAMNHSEQITIPTLLMHGSSDTLLSSMATSEIAAKMHHSTYVEWDELYHELHNETKSNEVFKTIVNWLNVKIAQYGV